MRHFTKGTLSLSIASLFSLATTSALAQESSKSSSATVAPQNAKKDAEPAKTQQVEIKAQTEVELGRKDAAAKTVVSNAELMRYGDTNVAEAMKRVPGVTVVKGVMQLPGMGAGYTQVLVDGEPPRGISVNDIPMSTIERVEIYRLGSAEFSSQGVAGTINIVLKKIPRSAQQQLKFSLTHTEKTTKSAEWVSSDKSGDLSYSLSLRASEFGFGFPQTNTTEEFDKKNQLIHKNIAYTDGDAFSKQLFVTPILQYKNKDGLSIRSMSTISAVEFEDKSVQDYQFILGRNYPIQSSRKSSKSSGQSGSSSIRINDQIFDGIKLDFNLGVSGYTSRYIGNETNFSNPQQLAFIRTTNNHMNNGGINSSLRMTIPSNEEHDIVAGWNGSSARSQDRRFQVDSYANNSGVDESLQTTKSIVDNLALFAQDEWKFRKNSSIYLGLRWEGVRVKSEGNTQTSVENSSSVWSPIAQTLWQLNAENTDRIRFGISRTYKAPPNFYLISPKFVVINNSVENPSLRGNPALKPELAWSLQSSFEHNDKEELSYSIKAVLRKISDIHRMQLSFSENIWWRQYVNSGEGLSKVLSFETQFPLKRFIADAPKLDFNFYVGRTWSSVSYLPKPDNLLVPGKLSANLGLDYQTKDQVFNLGGSLRYQDANPILISTLQRNFSHPSVDLDVYGLWKVSTKTKLRLSIDNILKRKQVSASQYLEPQSTTWRYNDTKPYRYLRLNFEHSF